MHSKACRVYSKRTWTVIESINVRIPDIENLASQRVFNYEKVFCTKDPSSMVEKLPTDSFDRVHESLNVNFVDVSDISYQTLYTNPPTS